MATWFSDGDIQEAAAESAHSHERAADPSGADHSLLAEDPLTGLPWTETLLPLVTNWTGGSAVHAVCLHFVGLGILANIPEFQSSHSLLREATERLSALMEDDDRLTRFSGNKLLIFTKRSDAGVRRLLVEISDRLDTLGTEVDGRHLPEIRLGMAVFGGRGPTAVTDEALNALMSDAAGGTVPMAEVVTPRHQVDQPGASPEPPAAPDESDQMPTTGEETATTMIIRGHPERTPIRPTAEPPAPTSAPESPTTSDHRLVLEDVDVAVTGLVATAVIDLDFQGRRVRGKAIGRSAEGHHIALVGEALTHAVTDLLPAGHGVVFRQAIPTSTDAGDVVVTVVESLTPDRTEFLFGVAATEPDPVAAVAKSVLNAVNRPLARLLGAAE